MSARSAFFLPRVSAWAQFTAALASTMPGPEWMSNPRVIMSTAVERRHRFTWAGVAFGFACSISATTPATCGAAIDVPEMQK